MKTIFRLFAVSAAALLLAGCTRDTEPQVSLHSLLREMTDRDVVTHFPDIPYTQKQISSYDRRSVSAGQDGWWANSDGGGYERLEVNDGRTEKVLCDLQGPGAIDRIWMTARRKQGNLRIYLDGERQASILIPAYDMRRFPAAVPEGLSCVHTHYVDDMDGVGGNSFFLPIPYAASCKITFEEPDAASRTSRYYHINYRTYPEGTYVRTFTLEELEANLPLANEVSAALLHPGIPAASRTSAQSAFLEPGGSMTLALPKGTKAVRELTIHVSCDTAAYAEAMRSLCIRASFDGKLCVDVPLADFSGGGMGAPAVQGWWLDCDGQGTVRCRFPMPYRKTASIEIVNEGNAPADVSLTARTGSYQWSSNSLYFHTSFRFEKGIPLTKEFSPTGNLDWNFMTISGGRGLYVGDVLSLYNYAPDWYGEGDEKIWIDDDTFPSHFGTGTEDYFNCSWAPVVPFMTPYGGAPRADDLSSHGYNAFHRTRILDVIPFRNKLRFDIEMMSWSPGTADYYTTSFWYGDANATANSTARTAL